MLPMSDMIMAREVETEHKFGDKPYLGFEHVTMVPMCRNLIDATLLTADEKDWLNKYHAEVLSKTKGFFDNDARTMNWLKLHTQPF